MHTKWTARRLAADAMFAAMVTVLGLVSISTGNLKITVEALPVFLGALLLGPVDGLAIGGVGTLLYQLLRFGVSATTALWIAPYVLLGLCVGAVSARHGYDCTPRQLALLAVLGELGITVLNTGSLYVDSLIAGRTFAPVPSTGKRAVLEARMRAEGGEALLRELHSVDPEAAARLHPADEKRIIRALEVWQETGRTITEHNRETQKIPPRYAPVWLGLDFTNRADLYARIDRRVEIMLEQGLLDEIRSLLTSGVPETATSLQAIGYKEFFAYLRGESTLAEATALCQQRSRNYAKRQLTWFRRNPAMHWIFQPAQPDADAVFAAARQEIPFFAEEI